MRIFTLMVSLIFLQSCSHSESKVKKLICVKEHKNEISKEEVSLLNDYDSSEKINIIYYKISTADSVYKDSIRINTAMDGKISEFSW